ncbi:MFS transporter [Streptomyces sp. NPDC014864]|uniref:MFS transporter n=1 Tax=Streptomyces sp. NPDC014864 TaxID=3364924 RepID=UPI0036F935A0
MTTYSRSLVRVLRDREAGLCLAAAVVSGFGSSALSLASAVWVKDLTGSNALAALCPLALWAPTLAGPPLGTLADRTRRRPLLIAVNLLPAALLLLLCAGGSPGRPWLLLAVLLGHGAAGTVHDAAESALVGAAVGPALLGDFNGLRTTATEGVKLLAPLAGTGLYAAYGGPAVAVVDAATFVLAAGLYALLRVHEEPPGGPAHPWRERTAEGARRLWTDPRLRRLVLAGGATMFCAGLNGALLQAVVDGLGRPAGYAGVLYAVQGAGSVAVGLVSGAALRRLGEVGFAVYGIALTGAGVAVRAVPYDTVALAGSAAIGAGLPCALIAAFTAVQRQTPGELLGRVAATAHTIVLAPTVAGMAVGAALVEHVGPGTLLLPTGLALLVTAAALRERAADLTTARDT